MEPRPMREEVGITKFREFIERISLTTDFLKLMQVDEDRNKQIFWNV